MDLQFDLRYLHFLLDRVRKKYCYLCEDLVSKYDWVSGNHRRECQKHRMHKEFLARLPAPYAAIVCPDCKEVKINMKVFKIFENHPKRSKDFFVMLKITSFKN